MLDALNNFFLSVANPLLGWMLHLPRDLVLFIVAIGTAMILTVVRLFTTNQELLKRCKDDKGRLKQLMREAKKRRDKEAVLRHRTTLGQIGMLSMKAEGKPLLASLIPIALLAVWCFGNIAYVPPEPGEPVTVKAYFPVGKIGKTVHVVPQNGIAADEGWIRNVAPDLDAEGKATNGVAAWTLRCEKRDEPYALEFRFMGKTYQKQLIVDGLRYAAPLEFYDDEAVEVAEIAMPEYKLFGIVPGIPWIMFQPWIVGYLVIVLPFSFFLKPLLRIH